MGVEKKDVEALIKAEIGKLSSRLDALEKKVDAHQATFNQRDEERRKKIEAMQDQANADGKRFNGIAREELQKFAGPQLTELKTSVAEALKRQAADKAIAEKIAADNRKEQAEMEKTVAEVKAKVDKLQLDARLKQLELALDARLKTVEAMVRR